MKLEHDWLKKNTNLSIAAKRDMIEYEDIVKISVRRQCELLELSRASLYYAPIGFNEEDQRLMVAIDFEFTQTPFFGARKILKELQKKGWTVDRKRVRMLMLIMGLQASVPTKNTSKPNPNNKVYPYLLRGVPINRVNQVWSMDITYIRLGKGFAYLTAIIDWHSRYVIGWRLSNALTADFCVECLKEALQYGTPEIFNTDQGCQFTCSEFIKVLEDAKIAISMDGRSRAIDNIFIERLWRTLKYDDIHIKGYQTIPDVHEGLVEFLDGYNMARRHSTLGHKTPWSAFSRLEVAVPQEV